MTLAAALAAFVWLAAAAPAAALELPPEPGPQRTVAIFDLLCLEPMPALDRVAERATVLGFLELEGADLDPYRPQGPVDEFRAWAFQDSGLPYALITTRGEPDAHFREAVPAFADATSTSCSLVLGDGDEEDTLVAALSMLLGRNPDRRWEQPEAKVYGWTAGTATLLHLVQYIAPLEGAARGVFSMNILRRE